MGVALPSDSFDWSCCADVTDALSSQTFCRQEILLGHLEQGKSNAAGEWTESHEVRDHLDDKPPPIIYWIGHGETGSEHLAAYRGSGLYMGC